MDELRRAAVGRIVVLATLPFALALILRGVPGSGPQCMPAGGPGTELAVQLELLSPDPNCAHGSLAVTLAGVVVLDGLLAGLLLTATRTAAGARRIWLAAPSRTLRVVRLLRRGTLASLDGARPRHRIDSAETDLTPQWAPSLRLRRGPPAVARPLPA